MSRAFVKEDDGSQPEVLPELPVSSAPNLVTARGLQLIEARIADLEAALDGADPLQARRLRRDLRYWQLRHATARPTAPDPADPSVQFGSRVTYRTEAGETRTVTFERPGLVQVYCNVHAQMSAFVVVRDNPWYTQPSSDGSFRVPDVPLVTFTYDPDTGAVTIAAAEDD